MHFCTAFNMSSMFLKISCIFLNHVPSQLFTHQKYITEISPVREARVLSRSNHLLLLLFQKKPSFFFYCLWLRFVSLFTPVGKFIETESHYIIIQKTVTFIKKLHSCYTIRSYLNWNPKPKCNFLNNKARNYYYLLA